MSQTVGYEKKDINLAKLLVTGISIVLFIVLTLILLNEYFIAEKENMITEVILSVESVALKDLRAAEDKILSSYNKIDTSDVVSYQIPIDQAMELIASEAGN